MSVKLSLWAFMLVAALMLGLSVQNIYQGIVMVNQRHTIEQLEFQPCETIEVPNPPVRKPRLQ